jgi:hypothetical protein
MYNSNNNNTINFSKVDNLVHELDECIKSLVDVVINDQTQYNKLIVVIAYLRELLFKIWNYVHGLNDDVAEFCDGKGEPTRITTTAEQHEEGVC